DEWVNACRRRSSGSASMSSGSDSGRGASWSQLGPGRSPSWRPALRLDLRSMRSNEVRGLPDRKDLGRFLVGNANAIAVLQLDHELHEVERVGLEVLLEARAVLDPIGVHLQLAGQVLADALEDLFAAHSASTLAALADLKAPASRSAS